MSEAGKQSLVKGRPYISRRQKKTRQVTREIRSQHDPPTRYEPYARKRANSQRAVSRLTEINDKSDSDSENLEDTMDRDMEDAVEEDVPTAEDVRFIDDVYDEGEEDRSVYFTQSRHSLDIAEDFFDGCDDDVFEEVGPIPEDRLRQVYHETPPHDTANVVNQIDHGYQCISVFSGRENGLLVDDTFINDDMYEEIIENGLCTVITGPMGCGKTTLIKRYINETRKGDPSAKFLYVTCNITLCKAAASNFGFACYLNYDLNDMINNRELESLVICINSLYRLAVNDRATGRPVYTQFTHVIFDEVVGVIDMIMGTLIAAKERRTILAMMCAMLNVQPNSSCILADALINERELDFMQTCAKVPPSKARIWRFFPSKLTDRLPELVYVKNKNVWIAHLVKAMNIENNRIILPTSLRDHVDELLTLIDNCDVDLLQQLNIDLNECSMMSGKGWFKIHGDTDRNVISALIHNHEEILSLQDRFMYTPVIQSGVDFNRTFYNVGFGLAGTFFPANTFVQMLRRCRNIQSIVPGRRAEVYVHVVGEEISWSEDCSVEHIETLLDDYAKLTKEKRDQLAELTGINVNTRPRTIVNYFSVQSDPVVRRLMAHTLKQAIEYRKDKSGTIRKIAKMNDPNWPWRQDLSESSGRPVTSRYCTDLLKNSAAQWVTGEVISADGVLKCSDPERVHELFKKYGCLGNKKMEELHMAPDAVVLPIKTNMHCCASRFGFCFSMFALIRISVFVSSSRESEAFATCKDIYNLGCMMRELFEAFKTPWKDHILTLRGGFSVIMLDLEKLQTLTIDVLDLLRYWKPICRWHKKFVPVLIANDIETINDIDPEAVPSAAQVTLMKNVMAACFGLMGVQCKMNDKYMTGAPGSKRTRKRQTLNSIRDAFFHAADSSGRERPPEDELVNWEDGHSAVTVTLSQHEINVSHMTRLYDLSLRSDVNSFVIVGRHVFDNYLQFDVTGRVAGPQDYNKGVLKRMLSLVSGLGKKAGEDFLNSASFWILRKEQSEQAFDVMNTYHKSIREALCGAWRRMTPPSDAIEPTFLLSENPQ